jgi:hypothetical protein
VKTIPTLQTSGELIVELLKLEFFFAQMFRRRAHLAPSVRSHDLRWTARDIRMKRNRLANMQRPFLS